MTEKTKKLEHEFPVEDVAFLVKALLSEGLEIKHISCSIHIGSITHTMELLLGDDDSFSPEPDAMIIRSNEH